MKIPSNPQFITDKGYIIIATILKVKMYIIAKDYFTTKG